MPPEEEKPRDAEFLGEPSYLEKDLEDFLVANLDCLEAGLYFKDRQVKTDVGVIDIVATDKERNVVIIELKVGEADDSAVGQVSRYMGWFGKKKTPRPVRGIIVANKFSEGAKYSASLIPGLTLMRCKVKFQPEFESLDLP